MQVFAEVEGESATEESATRFARGVVRIEHAHIPIQTWLAAAEVRLVPLALETAGTRIGYFPGPGDEVPASLRRVGYEVTLLDDDALRAGGAGLARFDAVVVGVRAFNTSERLRAAHDTLMKYVEAGGTLVVQYNTNSRIAPLTAPIGPFPFEIGRDRVTDETAAVTLPAAGHPSLTTPNKIGAHDFDGWIQERGLYFADKWDARYQTPLAMNDPGREAARRQPALGAPRQGDVRLHRPRLLPPAARRCAGRVSPVREPDGARQAGACPLTRLLAAPQCQRRLRSGGGDGRPARDEMHAAPPFLSWGAIYGIVLGALALQIAIYAALTAIYR